MEVSEERLMRLLRRFGHESFRPGQKRIIRDLLKGRDVLAVLPTGSGKSLVYQLASQLLPGATLVVSPLIALMKDQVESVEERGMEAGVVSSAQSESESEEDLREVEEAESKLLFVTPERFDDEEFLERMKDTPVSLFVVDEAHCISEWGHDFRPSYLRLAAAAARLRRPTLLALTATATPWVRQEIVDRLEMREPDLVVHGVDRPNLFLEVRRVEGEGEDRRILRDLLSESVEGNPPEIGERLAGLMRGSRIVYTRTVRAAEETAAWLKEWGVASDFYHGRRKKADREQVQDGFMSGEIRVIAATNAFGLGVDKPDVRFVIHRDVPAGVEAYYQEAGRAGRDGDLARCTLIYRPGDLGRAAFLSGAPRITAEEVKRAHDALVAHRETTLEQLAEVSGLGEAKLAHVVATLQREGILRERSGHLRMAVDDFDPGAVSLHRARALQAYERSRLEMMRGYAEMDGCRRRYLLNYFGEEYEGERCGLCDNDLPLSAAKPVAVEEAGPPPEVPFNLGDRVVHEAWGEGVVQRVAGDAVTVLFEQMGYKTLSADAILERGLIQKRSA